MTASNASHPDCDIAIIGAGQAALQTVASLKAGGFDGTITLIGAEPFLPYQRPPLSKKFLNGTFERDRLFLKPESFFTDNAIRVMLETQITHLDTAAKSLTCANGKTISFAKAVICTGSRPRVLPIQGSHLENIFDLRTIADIEAMRPLFKPGARMVVVGGGYIGLETAASARQLGVEVTIVEAAERVLARVTKPKLSAFFHRLHRDQGVTIITDAQVSGFAGESQVSGVTLANGDFVPADLVVLGIGIVPNIELAETAGLAVDDGIVVDALGRTSHEDIYAAGDCTNHPNDLLGRRLRLESVPNAIEQGKAVASDILEAPVSYAAIPWFWSDQYEVKLQIAGLSDTARTHCLRGTYESGSFAIFHFTGSQLVCVEAVNRPGEFMAARQMIKEAASGRIYDAAKLTDETVKPKSWLA
ncbi:MAG: pyridine nucleotide-disulfide oxidoreductase [Rhizobiales bacterium TMED83]|nr:pyridine nucleotide-disulfide oxidoreductase [Rhodobiaceae bacterium]RPF93899.1 MAG: pyridine nucleotide-disulfide oxidoreductase [Rhizobiales bacterium TMED83]